jgi:hypothetical protein
MGYIYYFTGTSNSVGSLLWSPLLLKFGSGSIYDFNLGETPKEALFSNTGSPIERLRHFVTYQSKTTRQASSTNSHQDDELNRDRDPEEGDSITKVDRISGIGDILVERMDHFVAVGCINADRFDLAQKALRGQLQSIPELVRDDLMNAALIERTSVYNVIQNSSKPMLHTMVASAYLGWYSTVFTPPSHYASCIMVSGISFVPGETVAGYEIKKTVKKIGETPCQCNYFSCLVCPVFDEQTTRTPIFKTDILTLDQHDALHEYMVDKAIQLASKTMTIQQEFVTKDSLNLKDRVLRDGGWDRNINTNNIDASMREVGLVVEDIEIDSSSDDITSSFNHNEEED